MSDSLYKTDSPRFSTTIVGVAKTVVEGDVPGRKWQCIARAFPFLRKKINV
jgi:hypothetical protein